MIMRLHLRIIWCCTKCRSGTFAEPKKQDVKGTCINITKNIIEITDNLKPKKSSRRSYANADELKESIKIRQNIRKEIVG